MYMYIYIYIYIYIYRNVNLIPDVFLPDPYPAGITNLVMHPGYLGEHMPSNKNWRVP